MVHMFLLNARAGVLDPNQDFFPAALGLRFDREATALGHGGHGIGDQIQKHLLELAEITPDQRKIPRAINAEFNPTSSGG